MGGKGERSEPWLGIQLWVGLCAALFSVGCGGERFDPEDTSGTGGAGSGGSGGEGGQGGSGGWTPVECIPSEASDAVSSECGVFVSSSLGDDGNDGSREKPFATVKKALEKASAKRIYVCSEATALSEDVLIERAVEMYGGLDCTKGWTYDEAKPTRIATAAGLIPMRVKGVGGSVRLEDFDLAAADAVDDGASSVGMFVANSMDVSLKRASITAGAGKAGANGVLDRFPAGDFPTQDDLNGDAADDTNPDVGGMAKPCTCPGNETTTGGLGGGETPGGQNGGGGAPDWGAGIGGLTDPLVCFLHGESMATRFV